MVLSAGISVIMRTNGDAYDRKISSLCDQLTAPVELVVVGKTIGPGSDPSTSLVEIRRVRTQVGRFEAMRVGVSCSQFESVLFVDDDQVIEPGLLEELRAAQEDAVIIPERSLNRNLVGRLMDLKREYLEELAEH